MSDIRESFGTLEIVGTQAGTVLGSRVEGDAAAAINGSIGFAFKDASGNVVLPQLNSLGQIPVTFDKLGDNLKARGLLVGTGTLTTVASITLVASKTYQNIEAVMSCFRDSNFQVIFSDNAVETILADALCGPGLFTAMMNFVNMEFTTGATGPQLLLVKGQNINALSDMRAAIAVKQLN